MFNWITTVPISAERLFTPGYELQTQLFQQLIAQHPTVSLFQRNSPFQVSVPTEPELLRTLNHHKILRTPNRENPGLAFVDVILCQDLAVTRDCETGHPRFHLCTETPASGQITSSSTLLNPSVKGQHKTKICEHLVATHSVHLPCSTDEKAQINQFIQSHIARQAYWTTHKASFDDLTQLGVSSQPSNSHSQLTMTASYPKPPGQCLNDYLTDTERPFNCTERLLVSLAIIDELTKLHNLGWALGDFFARDIYIDIKTRDASVVVDIYFSNFSEAKLIEHKLKNTLLKLKEKEETAIYVDYHNLASCLYYLLCSPHDNAKYFNDIGNYNKPTLLRHMFRDTEIIEQQYDLLVRKISGLYSYANDSGTLHSIRRSYIHLMHLLSPTQSVPNVLSTSRRFVDPQLLDIHHWMLATIRMFVIECLSQLRAEFEFINIDKALKRALDTLSLNMEELTPKMLLRHLTKFIAVLSKSKCKYPLLEKYHQMFASLIDSYRALPTSIIFMIDPQKIHIDNAISKIHRELLSLVEAELLLRPEKRTFKIIINADLAKRINHSYPYIKLTKMDSSSNYYFITVQLAHAVIMKPRKSPALFCPAAQTQILGRGSFGSVSQLQKSPKQRSPLTSKEPKKTVVKLMTLDLSNPSLASSGYTNSKELIKHLAIFYREFYFNQCYLATHQSSRRISKQLLLLPNNQLTCALFLPQANGTPLSDIIYNQTLNLAGKVAIAIAILKEVQLLHRSGILHLDLKPEHIYIQQIDGKYQVRLIDFGISTSKGTLIHRCGTVMYMHTELRDNASSIPADEKHDAFSIFVVLQKFFGDEFNSIGVTLLPEDSIDTMLNKLSSQFPNEAKKTMQSSIPSVNNSDNTNQKNAVLSRKAILEDVQISLLRHYLMSFQKCLTSIHRVASLNQMLDRLKAFPLEKAPATELKELAHTLNDDLQRSEAQYSSDNQTYVVRYFCSLFSDFRSYFARLSHALSSLEQITLSLDAQANEKQVLKK